MQVHVIGAGYVGLVTALALTEFGNVVTCWDLNPLTIKNLSAGNPHFYEPGLKEILERSLTKKLIHFAHIDEYSIDSEIDLVFIAVGTPSFNSSIDLSFVKAASQLIARNLSLNCCPTVVVKSTVTPGTTLNLVKPILQEGCKCSPELISVAMNPEFLREGSAVRDSLSPDRIVIGCDDDAGFDRLTQLYDSFGSKIVRTTPSTAEFSKYSNNVYLALQISMANELSRIANLDPSICLHDAFNIIKADHRWHGNNDPLSGSSPITSYLYPGCGFGGSCFPKDVEAIANHAHVYQVETPILDAILEVNNSQPSYSLGLIQDWLAESSCPVLILGIAFKPETDDCRESPALKIINTLVGCGHSIILHDPLVNLQESVLPRYSSSSVSAVKSLEEGVQLAEVIIVCTPWSDYHRLHAFQAKYPSKKIYDVRSSLQATSFHVWAYRSLANKEQSLLP